MTNARVLSFSSSALHEFAALPANEVADVHRKLLALTSTPEPDAKSRKRLAGVSSGALFRMRAGDYRVFYTFDESHVSVLAIRRRSSSTYDDIDDDRIDAALLGVGPAIEAGPSLRRPAPSSWIDVAPKPAARQAIAIDAAMLDRLRVAPEWRKPLLAAKNEDALLACEVPAPILERVIDAVLGRPLRDLERVAMLEVVQHDELLRYHEGELVGFLLRLDEEQRRFVSFSLRASGPTLLKGGPGTGKSTVAIHRVRAMLRSSREPKQILFATYTKALSSVTERLLRSLLGDDARCVRVRTADSALLEIAYGADRPTIATSADLDKLREEAVRAATYLGNALEQAAQRKTIARLPARYLLEEISTVIEGRGVSSLDSYLAAPRPGREIALNRTQRTAVWRVREALLRQLERAKLVTWEQVRALAAKRLADGEVSPMFDAVIIDEAQDLQPVALRALVSMARTPSGVFLTADANQSIYGAGFRWTDVHEWLKFVGRTGVLKANHRTTQEIGEAAESYLRASAGASVIDTDSAADRYRHSGPLPAMRAVATPFDEVELLARFVLGATKELRLPLGACAVLVPYRADVKRIAAALNERKIAAIEADADNLELSAPRVKVLTLKSAKGLEFPIVALAGFLGDGYPPIARDSTDEERVEVEARERRTLYVAITRAMRALLWIVPKDARSPLLTAIQPSRWNLRGV